MIANYNKHYIATNQQDHIIDGWSDGPHPERDTTHAICINDQGGYQFRLFSDGEENPKLFDEDSLPLYKYEEGQIRLLNTLERGILKVKLETKRLPSIKQQLIEQSKKELSEYLEQHPLIWRDKKQYSVTREKQALLTEQLALYTLDNKTPLHWNATGEPCEEWDIVSLASLAKSIAEYVRPLVTHQQEIELQINAATTAEEARAVTAEWEKFGQK